MARYECDICGHVHEGDHGWKDIDDGWKCPTCESSKSYFKKKEGKDRSEQLIWYKCDVCGHMEQGRPEWKDIDPNWRCPTCESTKAHFWPVGEGEFAPSGQLTTPAISACETRVEGHFDAIKKMANEGKTIIEPMRTMQQVISWDALLLKGAQLKRIPLNETEQVKTRTIIGPKAEVPLIIETPIYITHMSFGALGREAKIALSKGSALAKTAICSGEGGVLLDSLGSAHRYIFEYVPNEYSYTDDILQKVDAIEIKIGQSAKPGMGGHLPGEKVTKEISDIRGFPNGKDVISPAHFNDISDGDELKAKVNELRRRSNGKPIGIKFAGGNVEADIEIALSAEPDFITIDGRPGATGAAPKFVKDSTSIPTIAALYRAKRYMEEHRVNDVSLVITGGLRVSSDFAKALALGADAIAIGTAALIAIGCQQHRACETGNCPTGITTHNENLRKKLDIEDSAKRLNNYLGVCTRELEGFARLTGNNDVHDLIRTDLCTTSSEISKNTDIEHIFG